MGPKSAILAAKNNPPPKVKKTEVQNLIYGEVVKK